MVSGCTTASGGGQPEQSISILGGVVPLTETTNLIAAPLQGRRRKDGLTTFLDLATLEPYQDQWAFLSTLDRLSPGDASRGARLGSRRWSAPKSPPA